MSESLLNITSEHIFHSHPQSKLSLPIPGPVVLIPIGLYDFLSWRRNLKVFLLAVTTCHHVTGHRLHLCFIFNLNKVLAAVGKDSLLVWIRLHVSCYAYSLSVIVTVQRGKLGTTIRSNKSLNTRKTFAQPARILLPRLKQFLDPAEPKI